MHIAQNLVQLIEEEIYLDVDLKFSISFIVSFEKVSYRVKTSERF